ncbi:TonB-dependent receptor [candidate division KSB1 bacterium]|nr:TonB-dependent receptor [candidate division KSB1 bacterium]
MKNHKLQRLIFLFFFIGILLLSSMLNAQTTGKIAGKITDATTNDPLIGANILIDGTTLGAAAGLTGDFFIINVPPGRYTLIVRMIGYEVIRYENVVVSVNRTSEVNLKLKPTVIEGQEVVVQAEKAAIKKDQTSSVRNVSSDQIDILPVENIGSVIAMQAGVVEGHFRGGRYNEVAYLIDGVEVTESFGGGGRTVDLEPESIQDLEVITGTFNAEYGKAMSGIVNAVTKDGSPRFQGSISGSLAEYFTPHSDIFIGLDKVKLNRNQDYKFQLSGPIWRDKLTFFANVRFQDNKNYLNGIRHFNVDDFSDFSADDSLLWISLNNGDSSYVSMDRDKTISLMGKLTAKLHNNLRLSLLYTKNDDEWHSYSHAYKYNPDGMATSYRETDMYSLQLNHTISSNLFYELKLSHVDNYNGWYVFKDPFDPGYVHDAYHNNSGPGFYTGGQDKGHSDRTVIEQSAKFDLTWQLDRRHSLKTGFSANYIDLDNKESEIRNDWSGKPEEAEFYFDFENNKIVYTNYQPVIFPDSSIYSDIYRVKPIEYSAYIQDKMEFSEMVINLGVRFDYFDPKTFYPSQRRNPSNQLKFYNNPEMMSTPVETEPKYQISPRFGLSYQLAKSALLHFSYGHFFQMPPLYAMYQNHSFVIAPTDYVTTMGNSQIKAEKTVQYEIGLWQEIMPGMGIEVALFYRDIYDLLSAKVFSTFNQIEYGLYSNKDYGNVKGLELKYDMMKGPFSSFINYTLQYTRGNADNPTQTFDRAGNNIDPINRLIPMSWDQRHTLNVTLGYNTRRYGATMTGYYNSGAAYTWSPITESMLARVNLYPNNNWRPARYNVDLSSYYDVGLPLNMKLRFTLDVYNLLDRLNEVAVNSQTGRAYTAIIRKTDLDAHRSTFNEYIDRVHNPGMYSAPRMIKLGMGLMF